MNLTEPDQTAPTTGTATGTPTGTATDVVDQTPDLVAEPDLVVTDLIEEVSIDGMCGVY
jgi:mycofactocin precursor